MKTLSFHDFEVARGKTRLLRIDTPSDGVTFASGLQLIVAPNGYGKTSLLQTIAGVLPPARGEARLDGRQLAPSGHVLYVSEYLTFPKFIYPEEWVAFVAGKSSDRADLGLASWIEAFRLEPRMKQYLGRMSQGERRKVTWLGAHASGRDVLLLDEPLDGLDVLAIRAAREMVTEWKRQNRVVCIVAHQVSELLDLADEVFLVGNRALVRWRETGAARFQELTTDRFRSEILRFYS